MAISPAFVESTAVLKENLRLSGMDSAKDSATLLEQAIRKARSQFYRRLGQSRMDTLIAITPSDTPSTTNENLREIARQTEIMIVKQELTWTLPMLFQDASGEAQQLWNEEGVFRGEDQFSLGSLRDMLHFEIEQNFQFLEGEETAGAETTWSITTFEPEDAPPKIGESAFPDSYDDEEE